MNLIPCNSCFAHAQGGTSDLPSVTQYLSLVLSGDEQLSLFQSDMTSAFYLFRIPSSWHRMMTFNIRFSGDLIGGSADTWYRPCCAVIPMGWSSAGGGDARNFRAPDGDWEIASLSPSEAYSPTAALADQCRRPGSGQ